ncbi:Uncharacterised protein [Yersinia intermedia]|jgi:hypothetical protein|uniref:DUF4035 domain-containing protein n=1 Tax=Yersinia intermedia TaxID=631 RepID=A0ABX6F7P9_YERIN|nr:DUF4035 domain-containing protein [Yersinia intermedia]MCB5297572.1 DUF4035 domain-containing protein [Yersinia intermedia]OVZ73015.1 phage tail protein [Yersinia intermedia]QGR65513.1 DUF4035 domain-containing protein [Yersinia intermedia]QGR70530.1 DUF4035 domain-containing protein [Yersinia intermedia]CRY76933.1 Uncharacterised protein [Yersinia intermedia]
MTLALRLGRTLGELRETISMTELRMWVEYDRLSPIGDERGDYHAAQITAATYNAQGGKNPLSIADALLRWNEPADESGESGSELEAFLGKLAE